MTTPDNPEDPAAEPVEVPWDALSADALSGVLESFVLREGTDYGEIELAFDEKVARLRQALETGEARIVFDPTTETVTLLPRGGRQ